jgi:hypothetical protein
MITPVFLLLGANVCNCYAHVTLSKAKGLPRCELADFFPTSRDSSPQNYILAESIRL